MAKTKIKKKKIPRYEKNQKNKKPISPFGV